jgi:hypothetical protein
MDLSNVLAVWMHLGPYQVICLSVTPVTDCQQLSATWQVSAQCMCNVEHVQLYCVAHNQGADQTT